MIMDLEWKSWQRINATNLSIFKSVVDKRYG